MNILETLEEEFRSALTLTKNSVHRDYKFPEAKNVIKVAVGMRRSGKTYFLYQTIREMIASGVPLERVLFINFEDYRLLPVDHKQAGQMIDAWYALEPSRHNHCCYLFFDEVQNVEGWALVLRRLLDTKNVQIYVSGSSAKLLSKEIATSLRGRSLSVEIFPYSYTEYLTAQNLPEPEKPFGKKAFDHQRKYMLDYLHVGGFPGIQHISANEQLATLQNYVDTVIFRDIVERHNITNIPVLKYFIQFLLKSVSAPLSINKLYNDFKSQGYQVGKDTLHTYLKYLEDVFLIFPVPIFTESLRQSQTSLKKIYAIDNGLVIANTFNISDNYGKLFENLLYLDLRRQGKEVFYFKTSDGFEVDFITKDLHGKCEIIQVTWDTENPQTLKREERALELAQKELGLPGTLVDLKGYLRRPSGRAF